jgi:transcriptional regulator with XRE-family HTH domain
MAWFPVLAFYILRPVPEGHYRRLQKHLARTIQRRRKALRFTQEDVAHASGMAVRHYQKLEAGELNVTIRTLVRVARALRCDVSSFFVDHSQNG